MILSRSGNKLKKDYGRLTELEVTVVEQLMQLSGEDDHDVHNQDFNIKKKSKLMIDGDDTIIRKRIILDDEINCEIVVESKRLLENDQKYGNDDDDKLLKKRRYRSLCSLYMVTEPINNVIMCRKKIKS
ncbi:hypothetical protein LIER_23971 [Lithospermum erythrorhizon]|uniref:Uncharacterized protein n=1 Tax=Lithospermum erythrorhizon TaxID=34254 RepID=A0AAV3R2K0_LITER